MAYEEQDYASQKLGLIEELEKLRRFTGTPAEFWPSFLEKSAQLVEAREGMLLAAGEEPGSWKKLGLWPATPSSELQNPVMSSRIEDLANRTLAEGAASSMNGHGLVGIRLGVDEQRKAVAVYLLQKSPRVGPGEAGIRLKLIADTPAAYQQGRVEDQSRSEVGRFGEGLDLTVQLNEKTRFVEAAMTLVNEAASRYTCDRVSLGWLKGGYVRVRAVSHMENFEKKMNVVQELEAAMEEALDQDEEVVWPRPDGNRSITRNHEAFGRRQASGYIVSVPIRVDGTPIGVLTCERSKEAFAEPAVRSLRLVGDLVARRLADLEEHDRWIGARIARSVRSSAASLLGVEHTFAKILGIVLVGLLAFGIFGQLNYRVEAPFILKSDDVMFVSSPFDGFIEDVGVDVGDTVAEGDLLLSFDTRELRLQEANAIANRIRYERESEQARANRATADMMIADALAEQAQAQLDLVRQYLDQTEIRAPFAGVIVEGDLRELRGTPTRKGDALFRIARTANLYAELEVEERDAHELTPSMAGEIAFLSRPEDAFPMSVERTDPVATTREEQNVFLARAAVGPDVPDWWRPGMSGIAKIDIGRRNVLWILTHRTVDFLRMYFWW